MTIEQITHEVVQPAISKLARKLGRKRTEEAPVESDPRSELRRLVRLHKRWTRTAAAWERSVSDVTLRTGEEVKCTLPTSHRQDIARSVKSLRAEASALETAMGRQLRTLPVYRHFLKKVLPRGVVMAAYLCAMIDITKCRYVSNLIRYCGNACSASTGKAERRVASAGPKATGGSGTFNDELKSIIYMALCAWWKQARRLGANKYIVRWINVRHTRLTRGEPKGKAFHAGRRKATDLFLWDLYLVWRTLEGLPVWPDKYTADRGFAHGSAETRANEGRVFTLDEALALVGDLTRHPVEMPDDEPPEDK
jgi:hypothetical protein